MHCAPVGEAAQGMRWGTVPPMPALAPGPTGLRGMRLGGVCGSLVRLWLGEWLGKWIGGTSVAALW